MTEDRQMSAIASSVRRARRMNDWTQEQLADEAGVAPGTVNRIENAKPVRPGNLRAVLDALQVPMPTVAEDIDGGVNLAVELVRRWLEALDQSDRDRAIQALTRFTVLDEWRM